jgi:CHAD domain-containing protein
VGKTPGVTAEDHVGEAGRKVMKFHLARMLAREAGTREGVDPEELHAMRVATRRQRAAWRVFGASFRPGRTKRYRRGLREIAARLGAVRDLDVLLDAADAYRADLPVSEQRALEPLLADWREHRDDARVLLVRELDSDGYRRWVDDYRDFVRTEGVAVMPVGPTQPHHVRDTAASRIWAAYEQVRGYEPVLRWADVETLHELRIAGKWLRYTLEFVREALGDDAAPLIARVTALQDHLGLMNDADVSASMARTFLVEHAGELSPLEGAAIGRYLVSREREVARLRRTIGVPWRGVAGVTFRRTLGRVVAGL